MTSTVCHRFVQNAWKKERCSNCFKPKEEHNSLKRETPVSRRQLSNPKSRGIMKTVSTTPTKRKRTVSFKPDLTEVIGFGGVDWEDEVPEEEDNDSNENSEEECPTPTEEDKELDKITKLNTEQNANISVSATDRRRTFTQLMLGQPQKDSDGKKQTLLVPVTPFGQEDDKPPLKKINKSVSLIPIAKNKEILSEARPKVVLTSYTKNKDTTDMIKGINKAKIEPEVMKKPSELNTKIEKPTTVRKDPAKETVELPSKQEEFVETKDAETIEDKPEEDIYEVIETINEKHVKSAEASVTTSEKIPVLEIVKTEVLVKSELQVQLSPTIKTQLIPTLTPIITHPPSPTITTTPAPNYSYSSPHFSRISPAPTPPAFPNPCTIPPTPTSVPTPPPFSPSTPFPEIPDTPTVPIPEGPPSDGTSSDESADSLGPAESREQAGEPDGRADPEILCEPPALPKNPPPLVPPPRASFLHGKNSGEKEKERDKPKVPTKPEKFSPMVRSPSIDLPPTPPPLSTFQQIPNKRRAPNPPPSNPDDTTPEPLSDQQTQTPITIQPPSQIPDFPLMRSLEDKEEGKKLFSPLTISSDNLISSEEKRKKKFSLKKFLRVGGSASKNLEKTRLEDGKDKLQLTPKPRLVIVHPLELNGCAVEVVTPPINQPEDGLTFTTPIKEVLPPAPPPRNLTEKRSEDPKPPPKSRDLLRKLRQQPPSPTKSTSSTDNLYANLGEVRSGLAPSKPQRTASMREREALLEQQQIRRKPALPQENLYERINSPRRHSDETNSGSKEARLKPGSFSGSEPDLEIYSPCGSYYGSECEISEGGCSRTCRLRSRKGRSVLHKNLEDNYGAVVVANHEALAQVLEHLHQQTAIQPALRGLQSASVLHFSDFSIVDASSGVVVGRRAFYHALWGAHHVTLSVSKDQVSMHKPTAGLGAFSLIPVTEFNDLVMEKFLPGGGDQEEVVQASVAVLPWMLVDTVQNFGASIKSKSSAQSTNAETNRDACFVLLQFVNSLKILQAQGIEEVPLSLSNFILCHDIDRGTHHRLCLLQGFSEEVCRSEEKLGSLCQSATTALEELFPATKLAILIKTLLKKESAMSLSQVKSILEFSLWGPADVALGVPIKERELALQRWLDLERATVLHGLVGTRVQLSVLEEYHLLFLVRSSAKMMCEASLLLETNGVF